MNCLHKKTKVLETRGHVSHVLRRREVIRVRECLVCEYRYLTKEVTMDSVGSFVVEDGKGDTCIMYSRGGSARPKKVAKPKGKKCTVESCGMVKPLKEFSRQRGMKDGLSNRCRSCVSVYNRAYRERHADLLS
jgi:hypothetical protein